VKPKERITYPVIVHDTPKEAHDFLLIAVRNDIGPDTSGKIEYPFLYYRATLFIEGYSFPTIDYAKPSQAPSKLRATHLAINQLKQYTGSEGGSRFDKNHPSYLHFNNPSSELQNYALIFMDDSGQLLMESSPHGNPHVLYHVLNPENQAVIDIQTVLAGPRSPFFAVLIENPYMKMETEEGMIVQKPAHAYASNLSWFSERGFRK
jgi:hypothetical protein